MGLNTMPRQTKKRKGGAEKQREKKARQLLEDATKCHNIKDMFSRAAATSATVSIVFLSPVQCHARF